MEQVMLGHVPSWPLFQSSGDAQTFPYTGFYSTTSGGTSWTGAPNEFAFSLDEVYCGIERVPVENGRHFLLSSGQVAYVNITIDGTGLYTAKLATSRGDISVPVAEYSVRYGFRWLPAVMFPLYN